jgi:hypothetical protein
MSMLRRRPGFGEQMVRAFGAQAVGRRQSAIESELAERIRRQ